MADNEEKYVPVEVTDEAKAEADEWKGKGNKLFGDKHYDPAIDAYTEAINRNPNIAIYYGNRAAAYLKTELYGIAAADASKAILIDPGYVKGYYRRGTALLAQGKYKEGHKDFKAVVKVAPNDREARAKLKECEKYVKAMQWAEAMADDRSSSAPKEPAVNWEKLDVESAYTGPRVVEEINLQFVKEMMEAFKNGGKLHKKFAYQILFTAKQILEKDNSLVYVTFPESNKFTVCGDVHGQFYDLMNIFELNGLPSDENPYLFNGDFVDRGSWSVEVILTLLAFKVVYPTGLYMTRGNHESNNMNKMYGFEGEVKAKYEEQMMGVFEWLFCLLPLAFVLEKKVFVCHGGLFSKDGVTLDDIEKIDRNRQPPDSGIMSELLWSDPQPQQGRGPSKRGVGVAFGPDVTKNFLQNNNLELVVRSHECKEEGYEVEADGKLITIFSAPNYCDQMGNKGAFINFDKSCKPKFTQFEAVPHPPIRPMAYAQLGSLMGY
eukprot:GFYU01009329.1.p1 GENE.GFYU01009329.1~~GFYU01009329.1.p1  ORF type:complete len:491 (-),score=135.40 GFYU01009329.1:512-1984(-)